MSKKKKIDIEKINEKISNSNMERMKKRETKKY